MKQAKTAIADLSTEDQRHAIRRKANFLVILFFIFSLLAGRALFWSFDEIDPWLGIARIALPAFLVLIVLFLALDLLLHKKNPIISRISSMNTAISILSLLCVLCLCALDILARMSPVLMLPGMLILGFIYWTRPKFLYFAVFVCLSLIAALKFFLLGSLDFEDLTIFFFSMALTLMGTDIIRKNVLPGEERLRSLELENKELWNLSYRDTLTGLYNRRYMQQTGLHLFTRAVRYREQLHILMIDIDHFKKVNDKLGHAVGDVVLKGVAATIQTFIRTSDTVARYGGEEFIVYIVQSNSELTQFIANRIRDGVAAVRFDGVPWPITISIGIAGLKDADTMDSLIARSDQFLYMSKNTGRNRVSGY